ncbi:hypothetical protein PS3A_42640 [Pseudomonas sp. 3A(2025)]
MKTTTRSNLQAPVISVAEADGLIKLSDLTQDVVMQFPVWPGLEPRDAYQLALNGLPVGSRIEFPDPVPEGMLTLKIPLELLQVNGVYKVAYFAIGYPGGIPDISPETTIRIDRTSPGAALLAPLIFSQINVGDILTAHIPGYADMAIGDTLQTLCNGIQGPTHRVSSDDLGTRPMQIGFSRDFLQLLDNTQIEFSYQVTDRAGNQSPLAWPVTLTMSA